MRIPTRLKNLIPTETVNQLAELIDQPSLSSGLKEAFGKLGIRESWQPGVFKSAVTQARRWAESVTDAFTVDEDYFRPGINGTNSFFQHEIASLPMTDEVAKMNIAMADSFTLANQLDENLRSYARRQFNCDDIVVCNSLVAAIIATVQTLDQNAQCVVPRMSGVRIDDYNTLPELISRNRVVNEIGTANKCTEADLEASLSNAGAVFVAYDSDQAEHLKEARRIANDSAAATFALHRLAMPCSFEPDQFTVASVAAFRDSVQNATISITPGNLLFAGPECAVIAGQKSHIDAIKEHCRKNGCQSPVADRLRLLATLESSLTFEQWSESPIGTLLSTDPENLLSRAKRLSIMLQPLPGIQSVTCEKSSIYLSKSSAPESRLDSAAIIIRPNSLSAAELHNRLKSISRTVFCESDDESIRIELRALSPEDDASLTAAIEASCNED